MVVFVTGGSGVLGRASIPRLRAAGHEVRAPGRSELDLFDAAAVSQAVDGAAAVLHLATRIPPAGRREPGAWNENDRLRVEATRLLADAALSSGAELFVFASVAFLEPPVPEHLRSTLTAEAEVERFAATGGRGVVLRFGLLDGPGTDHEQPNPVAGTTVHVDDAGRALLAALEVPTGVYAVCRDGERVSNEAFKRASGWAPAL